MMVNIDETNLVGKGRHREVYRHPEDDKRCIKINIADQLSSRETREIKREQKYYARLQKQGVPWGMLPNFYGSIETNLGTGLVFDLMTDQDNEVSKTLGYYLSSDEITKMNYDGLVSSLLLLKDYLFNHLIIVRGLAHRNIACQKNDSGIFRLSIVDNIGNSEFIPISSYIKSFAKRKVCKKWQRFEDRLLGDFPNNNILPDIIKAIRQR